MKILLLANKTIGIFEVLYAVKSTDSFARVFMGFTEIVVRDDQKSTSKA
nr:hypothetical protein [Rickettsia endosymbiont of Ceutorhynchus assimilis]